MFRRVQRMTVKRLPILLPAVVLLLWGCGGGGSEAPAIDTQAPTVPSALTAKVVHPTEATLSWNESTDSGAGVAGYNVYRDGVRVGPTNVPSYSDRGVLPGQRYRYTVSAYDKASETHESDLSAPVDVALTYTAMNLCPVEEIADITGSVYSTDLNNRGDVIGTFSTLFEPPDGRAQGAYLFAEGEYTDLCLSTAARFCYVYGINDAGQIIGGLDGPGWQQAFVYDKGSMTLLGPLGDDLIIRAWDINQAGQVVGTSSNTSEDHLFLYDNGVMSKLETPAQTTFGPSPLSISQSGHIAGTYWALDGDYHVFRYADGAWTDLGDCWNDYADREVGGIDYLVREVAGKVVCSSTGLSDPYPSPDMPATSYARRTDVTYRLDNTAEVLFEGLPIDMNETGQIVGIHPNPDNTNYRIDSIFLWEDGTAKEFYSFNGCQIWGGSINRWGEVAGHTSQSVDGACSSIASAATLFIDGMAWDINDLIDDADPIKGVVYLEAASRINDSGQMVVWASGSPDGRCPEYLLTPKGAVAAQ